MNAAFDPKPPRTNRRFRPRRTGPTTDLWSRNQFRVLVAGLLRPVVLFIGRNPLHCRRRLRHDAIIRRLRGSGARVRIVAGRRASLGASLRSDGSSPVPQSGPERRNHDSGNRTPGKARINFVARNERDLVFSTLTVKLTATGARISSWRKDRRTVAVAKEIQVRQIPSTRSRSSNAKRNRAGCRSLLAGDNRRAEHKFR